MRAHRAASAGIGCGAPAGPGSRRRADCNVRGRRLKRKAEQGGAREMSDTSELAARFEAAADRIAQALAARDAAAAMEPESETAALAARVSELEAEREALMGELDRLRAKRDKDVAALDELIAQLKPLIEEV
jgi:hypothetical protein